MAPPEAPGLKSLLSKPCLSRYGADVAERVPSDWVSHDAALIYQTRVGPRWWSHERVVEVLRVEAHCRHFLSALFSANIAVAPAASSNALSIASFSLVEVLVFRTARHEMFFRTIGSVDAS